MPLRLASIVAVTFAALSASVASADIFKLVNQGSIRGQLLNPEEKPRKKFIVRTISGAVVTLDRNQVKEIDRESANELEYEKILPTYPDTVEGQWTLAEWCQDHKLAAQRQTHLARVIALEPDHKPARRALGFVEFNGEWKTQDQVQEERGLIKYKGVWRTAQEIELLEKKGKDKAAEVAWYKTLRQWRGWLATERAAEAQNKFRSITDPYALKAISDNLLEEQSQQIRLWYLESLSKIPAPDALTLLVGVALHDANEEMRLSALDFILEKKNPEIPAMFIAALRHKDSVITNRAAVALGRLKHPAAIGPLIDALVTTRTIQYTQGQQGSVGATFGKGPGGTGGGGLSVGQSVTTEVIPVQNQDVLEALTKLTGQTFEFNVVAWKSWFANQKKPETLDARRG